MKLAARKTAIFGIFAANLAVILYIWWQGSSMLLDDTRGTLIAFGRLTGLLLEYFILVQLVLVSRMPFVEQVWGFDNLNKIHRWIGYSLSAFIILHPTLLTVGYAHGREISYLDQFILFLTTWEHVLNAFLGLVILLTVITISIAIIRKKLKYETWHFTHLFIYVAIALLFNHQIATADVSYGWPLNYWLALNFTIFGLLLLYRFARPLYNFSKHRFVIERVVPESHDVYSLYITGRNMERFTFTPGQYINLTFLQRYMWYTHPFSFSSAPNGKYIRVSVKGSGDFTNSIQNLKPGTHVIIDGPLGVFTERMAEKGKFLFIAGGIGITPIRAMIESLSPQEKDMVLLYGNKTEADLVFDRELQTLIPGKVHHVLSQSESEQFEKGYIDREKIMRLVPDAKEREVYLCGPTVMMQKVAAELMGIGLKKKHIHYEKFAY